MLAAALYAQSQALPGPLMFLAADHEIEDVEAFCDACLKGLAAASRGYLVLFGIRASTSERRYGYIRAGKERLGEAYTVEAFHEKPDAEAAAPLKEQGCLWNSGNFLVQAGRLIEEYAKRDPQTVNTVGEAVSRASHDLGFIRLDEVAFSKATKQSIDYAVMEHTEKAAVVHAGFGWSDLGVWDAYWERQRQNPFDNVFLSETEAINSRGCFTFSEGALVTLIGLQDVNVIATRDAVLVSGRGHSHKVKDLIMQMRHSKRPEADNHLRCHRPWGWYQTSESGPRFQVKRIVVYPKERLSLQKHYHRAEHWIVVRGTALVTNGDQQIQLRENELTFIPIGNIHRLENPGKIDLELIEVQSGSYLGEDDIVRFGDDYRRS